MGSTLIPNSVHLRHNSVPRNLTASSMPGQLSVSQVPMGARKVTRTSSLSYMNRSHVRDGESLFSLLCLISFVYIVQECKPEAGLKLAPPVS